MKRSSNTSGYKGVYWNKGKSKWTAEIMVDYKKRHLGHFDTVEVAYDAYCKASKTLHGEFGNIGK